MNDHGSVFDNPWYSPIAPDEVELGMLLKMSIVPFLRHAQWILGRDDLFYALLPGAYLASSVLPESGPIPLGVLIRLWERRNWMERCPKCHEWLYIIGVAHHISRGQNSWWGLCASCNGAIEPHRPSLIHGPVPVCPGDFCRPVVQLLRVHDRRMITPVRPFHHARVCVVRAMRSMRPVEPATFPELLELLRERGGGRC